ncbi:hypothetical protein BDZ85DRAFT_9534 [Elsinoe ampelina]|uniref:Pentacotripeptide-repeat region of PRORP domain-containing protein n=1 Tax=Elsinoe ampelina TaxID=302913 RepID=A0A6A6GQH5_9PEZI|nr:hypothetical protein BDZ85DRAFT_9534 [Elsinoe ampelina]
MPSQLTRAVFRRLTAEQQLSYSGCIASTSRLRRRPGLLNGSSVLLRPQTRSFLGLPIFNKRRNAVTEPRLDPGIDKLEEHAKRLRLRARLNRPDEIRLAIVKYIKYKSTLNTPIEDQHVRLLHTAYKHVRTIERYQLDTVDLERMLAALGRSNIAWLDGKPDEPSKGRFAVLLLADLLRRSDEQQGIAGEAVEHCIFALTRSGRSLRARDIIFGRSVRIRADDGASDVESSFDLPKFDERKCLLHVIQGLSLEHQDEAILETLNLAARHGHALEKLPMHCSMLCRHHMSRKRTAEARHWYDHFKHACEIGTEQVPKNLPNYYRDLFRYCITTGNREWGQALASDALEMFSAQEGNNFVLMWAAGIGRGVEEIERMIDVMEESTDFRCDTRTINKIMAVALWQKDAYKAERFFNLGASRELEADASTYIMQMDYRCSVGDVDGALTAYSNMQSTTHPHGGEDVAAVNKLVRAMCGTRVHDFDSIMNVAADLTDTGARFEAETVSTLAVLHLSRAEMDDVEDLLNTHAFQYSTAERQGILEALIDFCLEPEHSSEVVWATYELLKKTFDDMNRDQRTRLMNEFMRRGHGHLAVTIFEHMRLHTREDTLPIFDTYIQCLKGISALKDDESFNALYNLLKLDTSIEPDTALHNALMEACIACGDSPQALSFWARITASNEGPDILSIKLAMRACQDCPAGDERAMQIHRRLEAAGMEMRPAYYAWVLAALAAHGRIQQTIDMMEQIWERKGVAPNKDMLGSLLNEVSSREAQEQVLAWAKQRVPDAYERMERHSLGTDVLGRRKYDRMQISGHDHVRV